MIELPRAALTSGAARGAGRVLLVRHQRPDADHLGHVARRRRDKLPRRLPRVRDADDRPVLDARRRRGRPTHPPVGAGGPAHPADARARCVRRARRRPRVDPPRCWRPASTTSPARRRGCPWPGSRPVGMPSCRPTAGPGDRTPAEGVRAVAAASGGQEGDGHLLVIRTAVAASGRSGRPWSPRAGRGSPRAGCPGRRRGRPPRPCACGHRPRRRAACARCRRRRTP